MKKICIEKDLKKGFAKKGFAKKSNFLPITDLNHNSTTSAEELDSEITVLPLINNQDCNQSHHKQQRYLLPTLLFLCIACLPLVSVSAADNSATTADEASVAALAETSGDGKVLSVSEQSGFYKVKVLVEGKVKVIKVPKADGS